MNKQTFLNKTQEVIGDIYDEFNRLPVTYFEDFNPANTAVVIVDMINGFAKFGPLHSERVDHIIHPMVNLLQRFKNLNVPMVAFADEHPENALEFEHFPPHCVKGTAESEIVPEIQEVGGYTLVPKNSTNGFLEPAFKEWLKHNGHIKTFIVVGDCTDICVQQFAVTLKKDFERQNQPVDVVVPAELVATYDLGTHQGDLMQLMGLYFMKGAGVRIIRDIE